MLKLLGTLTVLVSAAVFLGVRSPNDVKAAVAAMEAAQKTVIRPGDAAMSCTALEKELVSTMTGPSVQAYAATSVAAAQKQFAAVQKGKTAFTKHCRWMTVAVPFAPVTPPR